MGCEFSCMGCEFTCVGCEITYVGCEFTCVGLCGNICVCWLSHNKGGNAEDSLKQLSDPGKYGLHVNIFERFDESVVMMLDKLNMPFNKEVRACVLVYAH
eukprot:1148344-Prorocentrum_minimum.AAC.1